MVQQLRLLTPDAGDLGSILGQGTRSHVLQLRVLRLQLKKSHMLQGRWKTPCDTAKTQHNQEIRCGMCT